ncbi:hypothetical protein, partial [Escherichia coli]|uniref:hypothetical protein n=1 Tax=Escherichia coli TaxID=562 RepID=UPI001BDD502F
SHRALSEHKTLSISWSHYPTDRAIHMASAFVAIFIVTMAFSFYNPHKKRENGKKEKEQLKTY